MTMATGNNALAGREEKIIEAHQFPPNSAKDRTIDFKGAYISIVNVQTNHQKTLKENVVRSTSFKVPAGYTCYIRGATVRFI
ncbi:hypothetical protein BKA61DRAFT_597326 [Leptodontidium sp. MPI-SDFR-AT-0119]|nr:hypothetical protein BKA61DRAFT_597326 [Leptodontidium sp. MPI-SDFR-AT-0119]